MRRQQRSHARAPPPHERNIPWPESSLPVRAAYFVIFGWWIGWWIGAVVGGAGYVLCVSILLLSLGLALLNRLPFALTLHRGYA
jgi:hypothetical protein